MTDDLQREQKRIHAANAEARAMLVKASGLLRGILEDEPIVEETPLEASTAMEIALDGIEEAIAKLDEVAPARERMVIPPGGPTRQQGQFLAFIREYKLRHHDGVAPAHADFQHFFDLTPPSVNSMLIRLERRDFIRRTPH